MSAEKEDNFDLVVKFYDCSSSFFFWTAFNYFVVFVRKSQFLKIEIT